MQHCVQAGQKWIRFWIFHIAIYFEQRKEVNTMIRKWIALCLMLLVSGCTGIDNINAQETAPRMTKDQLKARLGSSDLILLDVRTDKDWSNSAQKIKGAIRLSPKAFEQWAGKYSRNDTLVLYCA